MMGSMIFKKQITGQILLILIAMMTVSMMELKYIFIIQIPATPTAMFRLWSNPQGIPFEDSFDESSLGIWIKSGNTSNISWAFQNGALKASPTPSGSGYGYLKPAILDFTGKDLLFK
jgi:hypothetical protein